MIAPQNNNRFRVPAAAAAATVCKCVGYCSGLLLLLLQDEDAPVVSSVDTHRGVGGVLCASEVRCEAITTSWMTALVQRTLCGGATVSVQPSTSFHCTQAGSSDLIC